MSEKSKKLRDKKLKKIWKSKEFSKNRKKATTKYFSDDKNKKKRSENQKEIWKNYSIEKLKIISKNYSKAGKKAWKNKNRRNKASKF